MTAGLLAAGGLFAGKTKPADKWNARGYYEHIEIDYLLRAYLQAHDYQCRGKKFQPIHLDNDMQEFRSTVLQLISQDGLTTEPWLFKSTKTAICWRIWHKHFPNAKWVLINRDKGKTLDSLERAPFMDAYQTRDEWSLMLDRYHIWMDGIRSSCDFHEFDVDEAIEGRGECERLFKYAGLKSNANEISNQFIERRLIHGKA